MLHWCQEILGPIERVINASIDLTKSCELSSFHEIAMDLNYIYLKKIWWKYNIEQMDHI